MKGRIATYGLDRSIRAAAGNDPQGYRCPELSAPATRPGADNHRRHPSLIGNTRRFHDGRIEAVVPHVSEVLTHE